MTVLFEKPNTVLFNCYRNYITTTKDFDNLERIEKVREIQRTKNFLTVLENEVIIDLERILGKKK